MVFCLLRSCEANVKRAKKLIGTALIESFILVLSKESTHFVSIALARGHSVPRRFFFFLPSSLSIVTEMNLQGLGFHHSTTLAHNDSSFFRFACSSSSSQLSSLLVCLFFFFFLPTLHALEKKANEEGLKSDEFHTIFEPDFRGTSNRFRLLQISHAQCAALPPQTAGLPASRQNGFNANLYLKRIQ